MIFKKNSLTNINFSSLDFLQDTYLKYNKFLEEYF